MKHFKNIELEKYVSNNWLRMHGIPARRKRQFLKHRLAKLQKNGEMFFIDEANVFLEISMAKWEKRIISGLETEEDYLNYKMFSVHRSWCIGKDVKLTEVHQALEELEKMYPAVVPELPDNNYIVGQSNCDTVGIDYNKIFMLSEISKGKKVIIMDDGEEYKSLSDILQN